MANSRKKETQVCFSCLNLAMTGEPRGFSRVAAGFSSYEGEFRMPLVLAQGNPMFHSSCDGKLGISLE